MKNLKLEHYLSISSQFRLGDLPTEQSHPETRELSGLAVQHLSKALQILKRVDLSALEVVWEYRHQLKDLASAIRSTFESGNRVYLCGCGSTGRLSIALETLWRERHSGSEKSDWVRSFMAGGDVALIKAIEDFEDVTSYAERQLIESGFQDGDLLIGCTEGGETPFVIGATEKALEVSHRQPFFLYCNPDSILCRVAERSKRIIENPEISKLSLETGPMAISGSTRMQASTVLMAAVGYCLMNSSECFDDAIQQLHQLIETWDRLDTGFLEPFIIAEADFYHHGEYLLYETDEAFGISVLTDTTERAPTFSLLPFENQNGSQQLSWCYLFFPHAENSIEAWERLLRRPPRTLEWKDIEGVASKERLLGFNFSNQLLDDRLRKSDGSVHHRFRIHRRAQGIRIELDRHRYDLVTRNLDTLGEHLLLKLVLNAHSTLVMGRHGRYEGNVMTWVRPSNLKLIDRTIRYINLLLERENVHLTYEEIASKCFERMRDLKADEPIVLLVVNDILKTDLKLNHRGH